jgi:hypothetical protein
MEIVNNKAVLRLPERYATSSTVLAENSASNISARMRQMSVADRIPASFS